MENFQIPCYLEKIEYVQKDLNSTNKKANNHQLLSLSLIDVPQILHDPDF
jgi:hypothetical protein